MEYASVKIPKDKYRLMRLLKAEKMRAGDYGVTDSEVMGEALDFSFEHESEFINRRSGVSVDTLLKYAGAWKDVSDEKIVKMKENVRKWRESRREFAW